MLEASVRANARIMSLRNISFPPVAKFAVRGIASGQVMGRWAAIIPRSIPEADSALNDMIIPCR
jgi:prolipoprotein diacylglyceryltransferase